MGVVIIRELVGTSPKSWSDAARMAVATAARTVRNIREVEVVKSIGARRERRDRRVPRRAQAALRVRGQPGRVGTCAVGCGYQQSRPGAVTDR